MELRTLLETWNIRSFNHTQTRQVNPFCLLFGFHLVQPLPQRYVFLDNVHIIDTLHRIELKKHSCSEAIRK